MGRLYLVLLLLALPLSLVFVRLNQNIRGEAINSNISVFTVDGSLIKMNGVVFNPRGIWNPWVTTSEALEENKKTLKNVSDYGFNVILTKVSPSRETKTVMDILNTAQQNNLKVIVSLQAELFPETQPTDTQIPIAQALAGVEIVKNHPALMGYLLRDEPDYLNDSTATYLAQATTQIKKIDPNHLTFTDLAKCEKASIYKNSADVIMHEHHIYMKPIGLIGEINRKPKDPINIEYAKQIQGLGEDVACFKKALGNDKPAWAVSFSFGNYNPSKLDAWYTPRPPTPVEYESIFYQWFINGMTGIIPYTFKMGDYWHLPTDSPELWNKMKELNGEQQAFYSALTQGKRLTTKVKNSNIQAIVVTYNNKTYLMAVNKTSTSATTIITTAPVDNKSLYMSLSLLPFEGKFMEVNLNSSKPTISDIKLRQEKNNLIVEWNTDLPSTSQVWYSKTYFTNVPGTFAGAPAIRTLTTRHKILISNLAKGVTYHFRAVSQKDPDDPLTRTISPESKFTL